MVYVSATRVSEADAPVVDVTAVDDPMVDVTVMDAPMSLALTGTLA